MLKRFSEIRMNDVAICGGKGASLGEMMNAGLPIPNGFVLTTKAYGKSSKEWENEVLEAFDKLDTKFVAVRSSGTKEDGVDDSFAGQFDTYLFVTRENLIEKIKECHDSVNSERIVSYCEYKGIDIKSTKVAVVVQKMVNSESAGVCFTVNPVSQNYDEIMIDAGFGVGEAVVSGMITPDNYIVNKKTGEIKKNISQQEKKLVLSDKGGTKEVDVLEEEQNKQKLSDEYIQQLVELAKKIEKHYGKPMDTERAIENGKLFMLQARPITTLGTKNENLVHKFLSSITKTENLLPPITSSSIFVQTCLELYPRYLPNYINDNSSMNGLTLHHKGKTYTYVDGTKLINIANTVIQLFFSKKLTENNILENFNRHTNQIDNNYKLYNYDYLNNLSNKELIELAEETINYFMEFDSTSLFSIMIDEDFLQNHFSIISKKNGLQKDFYKHALNIPILSFDKRQIEDIVSCIKDGGLNKKNLEKLQYLGTSYSKYTTLEDMEDFLLNNYRITTDFAKNETIKLKKEKERVKELKKEYDERYLTLTPQQQLLASFISMSIKFRDKRKNYTLKAICTISRIMEIFFDKNGLDKKYLWNIGFGEILLGPDYILGLKDKLSLREEGSVFFSDYNQQKLLVQEGYEAFADAFEKVQSLYNTDTQGNTIQGISGSSGKVKGVVKVIQFLDKDNQFQDGDILVTGMTRPEFVPLMKKASAIITDEGGITCHAAIISRELGIPCVIGTKIATQVLKDGDIVEVDADNGIVSILENISGEKGIEAVNNNGLNKKFNELKKYNQRDIQTFNAYPFFINSVATVSAFNLLPYDLHYTQILCEYENDTVKWHYDVKDYENLGKIFWGKCKNTEELLKLIDKYDIDYKQSKKELDKALSIYKKNKLEENRTRLLEKSIQFLACGAGSAHILECASYYAEKYFTKGKIITPHDESFLSKAHKFAKSLKSENDLNKAHKEFLKEYGWIKNTYMGRNTISIQEFSDLADEKDLKFTPPKYKKNSIEEMISYTFNRQDRRKENIFKAIDKVDDVLKIISKDTGINKKSLSYMLPSEVSKIDNKDFQEELENRRLYFIDYTTKNEHYYLSQKFENWKNNERLSDLKEIKGSIGNPGKIIGTARVCQNLESIKNFNEGDILVTSMTRPEFITAMRKASAFVTDEGGITCHAAIISRELGKPCIIGTKIATKVLKDGDLVEVDADNGIVSILKKERDISNLGNSSDYIRMFQTLYLPFINAYILNSYYKKLGVLSIYRNDTRTCYIPKDSMTETLKEGKIIYTDNDNYDTFIKNFELYKNSTISKYENIMNKKNLNLENIKEFLYSLPTFFEFYSKTEFFYTDSLFSPQQTEKEREKFLKIVENVKNPGREFFNKLLFGEQSMLNQLLTKISQKTGIGKESLFLSTFEEIVGYINNSKPDQEILNNRKIGYVLKGNGDNIELFYGDIASEYSKSFCGKSKNEKILKGRIANPGKTIGKVKIFKYNYKTFDSIHKTIESMNIGDILVAETTSPELIIACKKAGAIITNQGGMMSHAAIISRELNIPCLVGVNNATEILLDGMIVEVDANIGEVKIM